MKTVQINKIKYKIFEEDELREKLVMQDEDIQLILEYQRIFPELLQDVDNFCIDGEKLCNQLEVGGNFNDWLLANRKGKEGKLIKYRCIENVDFVSDWKIANAINNNFLKEDISKMTPQQRSAYGIKNKITLTLECAKKIAMRQNNKRGDLVCNYFILMEKTLRKYEDWSQVREPQKENANKLKSTLKSYAIKNHMDFDEKGLYAREFNMINEELTGFKALDIKLLKGYNDKNTRQHLKTEVNKIIDILQNMDIFLLVNNKSFHERSLMIKTMCESQYKYIKEQFN